MKLHISRAQPRILLYRDGAARQSDEIAAVCSSPQAARHIRDVVNGQHVDRSRLEPIEIGKTDDGALDEIFARGAFHLEQMDRFCWTLILAHENNTRLILRFGPGYLRVEEDAADDGYNYYEDVPLRTLLLHWALIRFDWAERWLHRLPEKLQDWLHGRTAVPAEAA